MNIDSMFYNKLIKMIELSQVTDIKDGRKGLFIKIKKLKSLAKEYHLDEDDNEQMINNINIHLRPYGFKIISNDNNELIYGDYKIIFIKTKKE